MKLNHLAIIMDGNGRWGQKNFLSRVAGHKKGIEIIENILDYCIKYDIKILTVYAFSTENWKRPESEVLTILNIFENYLINKRSKMNDNGIKLIVSGRKSKINNKLKDIITDTCEYLKNNNKLIFNICFDYGARQEIIDAINSIIKDKIDNVDENIIKKYMYNCLPDPDLVIRTGGEERISNFLLWQIAYSELYFTPCLWPDFNEEEFKKAIDSYYSRDRRYGGINAK